MKAVLVVLMLAMLMSGVASATTHTVCASGCDYTTIQAAVTAASSYDTVYVYNGTYTENVDVMTAHLTIEGEGREVVTVNAVHTADHVFDITGNYVNISGFTITGAIELLKAGMYISGDSCIIINNHISDNGYSVWMLGDNTNFENNIVDSGREYNFYIFFASGNIIKDNTITSSSSHGVKLTMGSGNNFTGNTIRSNNGYGIWIYWTNDNNFTNNTLSRNNNYGLYSTGSSGNIFTNNAELNNLNTHSYLQTDTQEGTVGAQIDFNFTMKDANNIECPTCSYDLSLSPSEPNLQHSPNGGNPALIEGSFTPNRKGIYSLQINITDGDGNSEKRKYVFLINTISGTVDYYFRNTTPTHGQPMSYGTTNDAGSLLFEPPSIDEVIYCGNYIGFSPDNLPDYLFGTFKNINYSIWYSCNNDGFTGVRRHTMPFAGLGIDNISITTTTKIFDTFNFSVDWANDYFWEWYFMMVKLEADAPHIYSNATHPSYANITYAYSTTPAIKSISNEDILLLSATSPAADNTSASIVLDGEGATNLSVQMPNSGIDYNATCDGSPCNDANCSFTQSNGELNFTLTLGSIHTLDITGTLPPASITPSPLHDTLDANMASAYSLASILPLLMIVLVLFGMLLALLSGAELGIEAIVVCISMILLSIILFVGLNLINNIPR